MAVVVNSQQSNWSSATAATTQTLVPTGIVAGRSLIALMGNSGGATGGITGVTDTGGNTWVLPAGSQGGVSGSANTHFAAAYVHNCVAPGTITVTSGSIGGRKIILLEVTGLQNATADQAAGDSTTGATTSLTAVSPSVTTSGAAFAVAFETRAGTADPTGVTAGWTGSTAGLPNLTTPILRAAWQEFGSAGATGACTFTFAATGKWGAGMIAFLVTPPAAHQLAASGVGA